MYQKSESRTIKRTDRTMSHYEILSEIFYLSPYFFKIFLPALTLASLAGRLARGLVGKVFPRFLKPLFEPS